MNSWAENLDKVKAGTATRVEFVDAITHWLGTQIAESTEGMYEAVSRRVVWIFPDNYALAVGTNFNPVFYHLTEELTEISSSPLPQGLQKGWHFYSKSNGWGKIDNGGVFPTAESILNLVELFTKTHGEPRVILPWGYIWTDSIVEQSDEDDWNTDEDQPEEEDIQETMFHLATATTDGSLIGTSPWELEVTDEVEGLSYYSDFSKFQRFIKKISESKLAILDLDQHCAGCTPGTYENAVKDDPELEGKAIFRTWGQNSENMWLGDGSICVEAWIDDAEIEKQLMRVAEEVGLVKRIDVENWVASGSFYYKS
jgi:hypothetical protein